MKRITLILFCLLLAGNMASCSNDYDDSALWHEIERIRSRLVRMNDDISALQKLVTAAQAGKQILSYAEVGEGYRLNFSDGSSITLRHGADGSNGNDGIAGADAPVVGIRQHEGSYYWTITAGGQTQWLMDASGNPIPVTGENGRTPQVTVDADNYWMIDGDPVDDGNGAYLKATGTDGIYMFDSVENTDTELNITLADGTVIVLQKFIGLIFEFDRRSLVLDYGRSARVRILQSGVKYTSVTKPDGWKVRLFEDHMLVNTPARANGHAQESGVISVVAVSGNSMVVAQLKVSVDPNAATGGAGDSQWQDL